MRAWSCRTTCEVRPPRARFWSAAATSSWRFVSSVPGSRGGPSSPTSRSEKSRPTVGEPRSQVMSTPSRVVDEVVEVELEQVAVRAHEPAHRRRVRVRVAVGREAHHLALVAVLREAEPLRDRGVEDPERVREEHAVEDLDPVAAPVRQHRRCEVAEAVDREDRGLVERRDEEGARHVGEVVLDVVEPGAQAGLLDPDGLRQLALDVARPSTRSRAARAGSRRSARGGASASPSRPRFARGSRPMATWSRSPGARPASCRHQRGRERRKAGAVLDAVEPLLLGGGDELAVDDERRRGVAVVRVQAEDRGHGGGC